MTTDMPLNSPTLYVLIGGVKSIFLRLILVMEEKQMNCPTPTHLMRCTRRPKLFLYIASGTPRYIPQYLKENRDIPRYNFFRGTQLYH